MEGQYMPTVRDAGELAVAVRAQTDVQASFIIAKKYPRNEQECLEEMRRCFSNRDLAEEAYYEMRRGRTEIAGESVRAAEAMAQCWRNMDYGFEVLSIDGDTFTLEGFAIDYERNVRPRFRGVYKRLIQRKFVDERTGEEQTRWVEPDELQFREMTNNYGARLYRNAILKALPHWVKTEIGRIVEQVLSVDPEAEAQRRTAIAKLVQKFAKLNVSRRALETRLGHSLDAATAEELKELHDLGAAIVKGTTRASAEFPGVEDVEFKKPAEKKPATVKTADQVEAEKKDSPTATNEKPKNVELLSSMYAAFKPLGVTPEMLGVYLKANPAQCAPETLREMIELAESIKRGELSLAETFPGAKREGK